MRPDKQARMATVLRLLKRGGRHQISQIVTRTGMSNDTVKSAIVGLGDSVIEHRVDSLHRQRERYYSWKGE